MTIRTLVLTAALALASTPLAAQLNRSAVSINGSDANVCTVNAPCRSFGVALSVTNTGGEILALDSGGFGAFTIDRSVTVVAPDGVHAAITTVGSGVMGVNVSALTTSRVTIRGLSITGSGEGSDGIRVQVADRVYVDGVSVNGFTRGIYTSAEGYLFVTNSTVRDASSAGIEGTPTQGLAHILIDGTRAFGVAVGTGFVANEGTVMSVRNSVTANNEFGFRARSTNMLRPANVAILNTHVSENSDTGIFASGTAAFIRVAGSAITSNGTGVVFEGSGSILSAGNNVFAGTGSGGTFSGTFSPQ